MLEELGDTICPVENSALAKGIRIIRGQARVWPGVMQRIIDASWNVEQ
jgi:hypothetical protein